MKIFITLILTAITSLILFCLIGYWTNRQLEIEELTLKVGRNKELLAPLTILHVSDIHAARLRVSHEKLLSASQTTKPDVILITGDTIDRTEDLTHSQISELIQQFTEIAPTYVIEGNHEPTNPAYEEWRQLMKNSSAILLENEVYSIDIKGQSLNLIGLKNNSTELPEAEAAKLINTPTSINLLLAHHPELFEEYLEKFKETPLTAIFSGHAHGGQIRLWGNEGLLAPNQGFQPTLTNGAYTSKKQPSTTLYVSRGLGNSSFPFRINNKPHLISLTLN